MRAASCWVICDTPLAFTVSIQPDSGLNPESANRARPSPLPLHFGRASISPLPRASPLFPRGLGFNKQARGSEAELSVGSRGTAGQSSGGVKASEHGGWQCCSGQA